jgi:hypothetical protein
MKLSDVHPKLIQENDKIFGANNRRGKIIGIRLNDEGENIFTLEWLASGEISHDIEQHRCSNIEYRGKKW